MIIQKADCDCDGFYYDEDTPILLNDLEEEIARHLEDNTECKKVSGHAEEKVDDAPDPCFLSFAGKRVQWQEEKNSFMYFLNDVTQVHKYETEKARNHY